MTDKDKGKKVVVIYQSVEASYRLETARKMLRHNFNTQVIELETQISVKTLRKLRKEMTLQKEERRDRLGRSVPTIVKNTTQRKIASLFLHIYVVMCGKEHGVVDIDLLIQAYYIFLADLKQQNRFIERTIKPLTISEVYSLASAYQRREISLEICSRCGTPHAEFYKGTIGGCPNAISLVGMHGNVMDERTPMWSGMKRSIYSQHEAGQAPF